MNNPEGLLRRCREKYGEIFTIYIFGALHTVVGECYSPEIFKSPHMSFIDGLEEKLPLAHITNVVQDPDYAEIGTKLVSKCISGRMEVYQHRVFAQLQEASKRLIGDCKQPKLINEMLPLVHECMSRAIADIFVGEELAKDDEVVNTFRTFTRDITDSTLSNALLTFIHPKLYMNEILFRFKFGSNPATKHKSLLIRKIRPIVAKRLEQEAFLGSSYSPPNDLLQDLLEHPRNNKADPNYEWMVSQMIFLIWAGIHSTTRSALDCLFDYAGRSEYWDELVEEQRTVLSTSEGDDWRERNVTVEELAKMEKLDSFLRESMRLEDLYIDLDHRVMSPVFRFSNGIELPEGRHVVINFNELNASSSLHGAKPNTFDGFRYVNKSSPAHKVTRDFLHFGLGRHACPGRVMSVVVMKMFVSLIIRKYNVVTQSGTRPKNLFVKGLPAPCNEPLIFTNKA